MRTISYSVCCRTSTDHVAVRPAGAFDFSLLPAVLLLYVPLITATFDSFAMLLILDDIHANRATLSFLSYAVRLATRDNAETSCAPLTWSVRGRIQILVGTARQRFPHVAAYR